MHKFVSNSREVMEMIPCSERANVIKDLDLSSDDLPIERALGIQWCVESDSFQFRLVLKEVVETMPSKDSLVRKVKLLETQASRRRESEARRPHILRGQYTN